MAKVNATRTLLKARYVHSDVYVGTAEQLCACGLVLPGQFPGQPGRGKICATYFLVDGEPTPRTCSGFEQTYTVQRAGSNRFSVSVDVSDEEAKRRRALPSDKGNLPLDLPQSTSIQIAPAAPTWAPTGFAFRCRREKASRFVFEASIECIRASGIMGAQVLPAVDDEWRKCIKFRSPRFEWVVIAKRTARTFIVALSVPSEIRNVDFKSSDYSHSVYHRGTKQQLQERGLGMDIGFPGEPGCNSRKLSATIPETGGKMSIELLRPEEWCGDVRRFEVVVRRSEVEQAAQKEIKRAALEAREQVQMATALEYARIVRLRTMPATPDKFRDGVAETFWALVDATRSQMQPKEGYGFTSEAVDDFIETAADAYWAIKEGETTGSSPRKKLQQVMCEKAKTDAPLQRFLASINSATSD